MTKDEIVNLRVNILGDGARKDLESFKKGASEVKKELLEMENSGRKSTDEYKQLLTLKSDINMESKKARANFDLENASLNQMRQQKTALNRELNNLIVGSKEWMAKMAEIKPVSDKINDTTDKMKGLGKEVVGQQTVWGKLGGWIKGAFVLGGVMALVNWLIDTGKAIFDVTGKFEQYNTTLKNMFKSQEVATMAMEMIKKEAAKTNWSVDQLTDAFIKLKGRGINMTSKDVQGISDVANYLKKDFGQVVEAINDINNTERWNEIGIKAKTNGDKVSLTFNGVTKQVARTEAGVMSAITEFGQMNGVMGLTAEIAEGLVGKQSNLGDKIMFLASTIGEKLKPVFNFILDLFIKGVEIVGDFVDKSAPLGVVFDMISKTAGSVAKSFMSLFYEIFPDAKKSTFDMATLVKILATAFAVMTTPVKIVMTLLTGLIDTYRVLYLAMNMAWAGMKGDFKGMAEGAVKTELAWNKLKTNAVSNFTDIGKTFSDIWKKGDVDIKKSGMTFDEWVAAQKKGQNDVTTNAGKNGKEREAAAKKTAKELEKAHKEMLKAIEKANEEADKTIRKTLADHVKAVKTNNAEEMKAHEKLREELVANALKMASFQDAAMKLERVKKATTLEEIEEIEKEYIDKALKRELEYAKITLQRKEKDFKDLKALGALTKEEEDKRAGEVLKLKNELADKELAIVKKGVSDKQKALKDSAAAVDEMWKQEVEAYKKSVEEQKETAEKMAEHFNKVVGEVTKIGYAFAQNLLGNAGAEIDALINGTTDRVEKARLESRKISNEMGKSFIDTVASFATGDVSGGISGLIGVLSGAVSLFNQNAQILVAELEVLYDKLSADANFLMNNVEAVKSIYGDMAFNMPSFEDYSKVTSAIEASISAEIKVGEQINANYELATGKENEYFEQRKQSIEDAYALDVQRINDKYALLDQKAGQAKSAESLALQNASNEELLALIKNEDAKLSVMTEYGTKKSDILRATALADMQITDDMDAATVKAINDARDLRANELSKLADWYQGELVFMVNNEGQKRKEYGVTDTILNGLKAAQDALDLKYAMAAIIRERDKTAELVALEKDKNTQLEVESKRYNDALVALGVARDVALEASFNRLKDTMNSGYQEMIASAEQLYQKGIITANQFVELVNQIRYFKSLLNDGAYTDTGAPSDVPYIEPIVIPKFARGTEYVDPDDYYPDGTDTVPAMLNKGERVLTAIQNKQLGNVSNEELVRMVAGFGSPAFGYAQAPGYVVDGGLVNRVNSSGVPTMGSRTVSGGSWVSSPMSVMGGFGGFGSAQPLSTSGAGGGTAGMAAVQDNGVAGALAENNKLMTALVNLIANQTNEELKRIADKPPLTLHDVNAAKDVERGARVVSDF